MASHRRKSARLVKQREQQTVDLTLTSGDEDDAPPTQPPPELPQQPPTEHPPQALLSQPQQPQHVQSPSPSPPPPPPSQQPADLSSETAVGTLALQHNNNPSQDATPYRIQYLAQLLAQLHAQVEQAEALAAKNEGTDQEAPARQAAQRVWEQIQQAQRESSTTSAAAAVLRELYSFWPNYGTIRVLHVP